MRRQLPVLLQRQATETLLELVSHRSGGRANIALLAKATGACDQIFGTFLATCGDYPVQVLQGFGVLQGAGVLQGFGVLQGAGVLQGFGVLQGRGT